MYKKLFYSLVGCFITFGLFSCEDKPKSGRTDTRTSGEITIAVDESFSPIMEELIQVYEALNPKTKINALYTDEVNAVNLVLNDSMYMAVTSRRFTQEEFDNLKARDMLPEMVPLAYDGMALICNNQNTDSCITAENVRRILAGEVKNWNEIYPNSKMGEIDVVFDNPKSSTVRYCVDSILGGQPINSANIGAVLKSSEVVDYVERTPNAIGIIGSNWLNDKRDTTNVTFKRNVTVMKVSRLDSATVQNSWRPYQYYLYNGNYPFVRTIYALINEPRTGTPTGFANFCRLPQGQMVLFRAGLLPIIKDLNVRQVEVVRK